MSKAKNRKKKFNTNKIIGFLQTHLVKNHLPLVRNLNLGGDARIALR